jgi:hypothetical protein
MPGRGGRLMENNFGGGINIRFKKGADFSLNSDYYRFSLKLLLVSFRFPIHLLSLRIINAGETYSVRRAFIIHY